MSVHHFYAVVMLLMFTLCICKDVMLPLCGVHARPCVSGVFMINCYAKSESERTSSRYAGRSVVLVGRSATRPLCHPFRARERSKVIGQ